MQKRLRKALSVLLAVALLAGSLPGIPAFAGGGGLPFNNRRITRAERWRWMRAARI